MGSSRMPWKRQESCIWTQCFTKNVIRYGLDQVMFHSSTMRKSRYERPSPQLTSPVSTVTDLSPHFRFEKQIKTVQTWCFCTKKKNDWSWGLLMENLKYWLLIGRANLISTNGLSFTVCSQPFWTYASASLLGLIPIFAIYQVAAFVEIKIWPQGCVTCIDTLPIDCRVGIIN